VFWAVTTQKKDRFLCFSCHVRHDRRKAGCDHGQKCAVPKITCGVSDRKISPGAPGICFGLFFGPVDPNTTRGHRKTSPNAASRSSQHAEKILLPAGGSIHPPLARGNQRKISLKIIMTPAYAGDCSDAEALNDRTYDARNSALNTVSQPLRRPPPLSRLSGQSLLRVAELGR